MSQLATRTSVEKLKQDFCKSYGSTHAPVIDTSVFILVDLYKRNSNILYQQDMLKPQCRLRNDFVDCVINKRLSRSSICTETKVLELTARSAKNNPRDWKEKIKEKKVKSSYKLGTF